MKLADLASKNVAILGVGIEGLALAKFLLGKCRSLTLLDKKKIDQLEQDYKNVDDSFSAIASDSRITTYFGDGYLSNLKKFDLIFRSPGIKYFTPEIQDAIAQGVEVSSQIRLFFDLCPSTIIGVTGTKGKGTTSSLINSILSTYQNSRVSNVPETANNLHLSPESRIFLAGNIGMPAISLINQLNPKDFVILELSSFQLQDLHKSPQIAVVLNISSDHLDYHQNQTEYVEAKLPLVKFQNKNDIAIINMDYLTSFEFAAQTLARTYFFSGKSAVEDGAYVHAGVESRDDYDDVTSGDREVIINLEGNNYSICKESEIRLVGGHNMENIAAAALVASLLGVETDHISYAVKHFSGLPHRLEKVAEIKEIDIYNDSFSTNPEPTIAALRAFRQPKLLILGGSTKGADFTQMAKAIASGNVSAIALIGDEAGRIKAALMQEYDGKLIESGYNYKNAIDKLLELGKSGDVLIFSPACASFDMFKNYKDRGEKFKEYILSIVNNGNPNGS